MRIKFTKKDADEAISEIILEIDETGIKVYIDDKLTTSLPNSERITEILKDKFTNFFSNEKDGIEDVISSFKAEFTRDINEKIRNLEYSISAYTDTQSFKNAVNDSVNTIVNSVATSLRNEFETSLNEFYTNEEIDNRIDVIVNNAIMNLRNEELDLGVI